MIPCAKGGTRTFDLPPKTHVCSRIRVRQIPDILQNTSAVFLKTKQNKTTKIKV